MTNLFSKLFLGLIFSLVLFIPIIVIATFFGLTSLFVWSMFAIIIILTAIISDESAVILMDSFSDKEFVAEKVVQCSFCGEHHSNNDCYYMGTNDLIEEGLL